MPEEEHFEKSRIAAEKIHNADPEIILQACIFEALYREDVESVKVPAFVFEAFGLPFEDRFFDYDACIFDKSAGTWDCMPDISQLETQMWFYYRGARYIDCGYEAFHMGQIHLYTGHDRAYIKANGTYQAPPFAGSDSSYICYDGGTKIQMGEFDNNANLWVNDQPYVVYQPSSD